MFCVAQTTKNIIILDEFQRGTGDPSAGALKNRAPPAVSEGSVDKTSFKN